MDVLERCRELVSFFSCSSSSELAATFFSFNACRTCARSWGRFLKKWRSRCWLAERRWSKSWHLVTSYPLRKICSPALRETMWPTGTLDHVCIDVVLLEPHVFLSRQHQIRVTENRRGERKQWPLETTLDFKHCRFDIILSKASQHWELVMKMRCTVGHA